MPTGPITGCRDAPTIHPSDSMSRRTARLKRRPAPTRSRPSDRCWRRRCFRCWVRLESASPRTASASDRGSLALTPSDADGQPKRMRVGGAQVLVVDFYPLAIGFALALLTVVGCLAMLLGWFFWLEGKLRRSRTADER